MRKKKNRVRWLKDVYLDKVSTTAIDKCKDKEEAHELTGGTFKVKLMATIPIFGVLTVIPFIETFTDKCSCPKPLKDRCNQELILVTYNN